MVSFHLVSNDPSWRESVVYDEQYARWPTGLVLTLLASLISYMWTANYSDFMRAVRRHTLQANESKDNPAEEDVSRNDAVQSGTGEADPGAVRLSVGSASASSMSSVGATSILVTTALQAAKLRPLRIILFALSFMTFVVMDFISLAIVPLTLVVPTIMMIFLWGAVYRAIWQRSFDVRSAAETTLIAVLVAVGVGVSPKGLYIVHVRRVVDWNVKSIVYSTVFVGVCAIVWLLRRSRPNRSRNTETLISGTLSGILGGQALVLLKLVAEICENAIFHSDNEFEGASAFVVVCLSLIMSALHLFSLHTTLARLDEANVRLLVPVHRLALMGSASIGAGVYLEEWKVPEASALRMGIYYGVSMLGLALLCAYFAVRSRDETGLGGPSSSRSPAAAAAVPPSARERARRKSNQVSVLRDDDGDDDRADADGVIVVVDGEHCEKGLVVSPRSRGQSWWTLGQGPAPSSCAAALGLAGARGAVDHDDDDDRDLHLYHMSRSRSLRDEVTQAGSPRHVLPDERIQPTADSGELALPPPPPPAHSPPSVHDEVGDLELATFSNPDSPKPQRPGLPERASSTRSDASFASAASTDSFHSIMDDLSDDDEEAAMSMPGTFRLSVAKATKHAEQDEGAVAEVAAPETAVGTVQVFDNDYPMPESTMVYPRAVGTAKSYWVDAGLLAGGWKVRGLTYDQDRVKVPCDEARMAIAALEWIYAPDVPYKHMSARPDGFVAKHHLGRADRPFLVIVNFVIPSVGHYVSYLRRRPEIEDEVFDEMLDKFICAESDDYRNARLKLIPGVLEGSYFVRKAVGAKPALLCQKLTTTYHRGENHFEITIDVGSSAIGSRIFSAVKGFASSLVLHLGIVLESKTRAELPERLMVGVDIYTPAMNPDSAPRVGP